MLGLNNKFSFSDKLLFCQKIKFHYHKINPHNTYLNLPARIIIYFIGVYSSHLASMISST